MVVLPVVVFYGGQWNYLNCYENYKVAGVLVEDSVDYNGLLHLISGEIETEDLLELSVLLNFGDSNVQTVFGLKQDKDVLWFLTLARDSSTRHPIVAHISPVSLQESSDVPISSIGGDRMPCLSSSSSC